MSFSGKSLAGAGSGNYTLTQQGNDTGKSITAKETPAEETPVKETPVKETPVKEAPTSTPVPPPPITNPIRYTIGDSIAASRSPGNCSE